MRMILAGLTALLLVGCGGGGTTATSSDEPSEADATEAEATESEAAEPTESAEGPTKDEFITKAIEECKAVNEATAALEPEEDPFTPDASEELRAQGVAFLQAFGDGLNTFATNLRDFGIPPEEPEGAEAVITGAETSAQAMLDAAATAEETPEEVGPAIGEAFGSLGALEQAATEYGIGSLENCGEEPEPAEEPDPDATQVAVTPIGEDGKYDWEIEPVEAGKIAFVMENTDDEQHFMYVVKLKNEGDLAKALEAEQNGNSEKAQKLATDAAESQPAPPGGTAVANADLEAGFYGMLCFIPGPDGAPHAFNGMATEFEVK